MIIKTPLRVSLFGGGSDMPDHFYKNNGHVLGFTINKYVHNVAIQIKFDHGYKYRLSYRLNEEVISADEIKHPIYKTVLNKYLPDGAWHFLSITDIPSGSGLGSSSTFTVGLIKLIKKILNEDYKNANEIAKEAINLERNILKESGGWQDQIHAAFTGMNAISFKGNEFVVDNIRLPQNSLELMNKSMYIIFSGKTRSASVIESSKKITNKTKAIEEMVEISKFGAKEIASKSLDLKTIGNLLEDNWKLKKSLSSSVSSKELNEFHDLIIESGAYGAKLCGAGGGGFFFVLSDKGSINKLQQKVGKNIIIEPINISSTDNTYIRDEL